ncbi:hypothetical protein PHLCEN_2v4079 [Hermanssonia centrifuga]|uniref:Uncharacterized protein n=1 Tax=Hermanssonia centrifuga TaxID=98765 RepID=A0A2R6Q2T1_9APHY|nr:hypothetical protein PHLCEN_2v4079 [Hermanssonia centrifuga]
MPRYSDQAERIIEQLAAVRDNITVLNEQLKQVIISQKEALLHKQRQSKAGSHSRPAPKPAHSSPDAQEETFWNTPGAAARTLHFTGDLLADEEMDLSAFASPLPVQQPRARPRHATSSRAMQFTSKRLVRDDSLTEFSAADEGVGNAETGSAVEEDTNVNVEPDFELDPAMPEGDDDDDDTDDKTVVLTTTSPVAMMETHSTELDRQIQVSTVCSGDPQFNGPEQAKHVKARTKVTTEVERIVAKIWSTVGDVIMPGHPYDASGSSSSRPPRAKETIAHLQSISTQIASAGSPSASSLSSLSTLQPTAGQPTAQQILTAQMLLTLLNHPPSYSLPLNRLKEILAEGPGAGQSVTRPIYGCVAKRLLKIDRGGGEQVVRFDA